MFWNFFPGSESSDFSVFFFSACALTGTSVSFFAPIILGTSFLASAAALSSLSLSFSVSLGASRTSWATLLGIWLRPPVWVREGASLACWMRSFERSSGFLTSWMAASMASLSLASRVFEATPVPSMPSDAAFGADPELSRSMITANSGFDGSSEPRLSLLTC